MLQTVHYCTLQNAHCTLQVRRRGGQSKGEVGQISVGISDEERMAAYRHFHSSMLYCISFTRSCLFVQSPGRLQLLPL